MSKQAYNSNIRFTGGFGPLFETESFEAEPMTIRKCAKQKHFAVTFSNGTIKIFSVNLNQISPIYLVNDAPDNNGMSCTDCVPVSIDGKSQHLLLAVYASGTIALWHYSGANQANRLVWHFKELAHDSSSDPSNRMKSNKLKSLASNNEIICCDISQDSQRFITAGSDSVIRVYRTQDHSLINSCYSSAREDRIDGHSMKVCFLRYHPKGFKNSEYSHIFISGGWDRTFHIWDDRFTHSLWVFHGPYLGCNDSLDLDLEFNHIVTASYTRSKSMLQVWRFPDDMVHELKQNFEYQQFGSTEQPIVEVSADNTGKSMQGFIAKWIGSNHMLYVGHEPRKIVLFDRSNLMLHGTIEELSSSVVSICFIEDAFLPYSHAASPILVMTHGSKLLFVQMNLN